MSSGYRLLMLAGAAAVAIALASGPDGRRRAPAPVPELPAVCGKSADAGTRPSPRGLLMVADLATPCADVQGS